MIEGGCFCGDIRFAIDDGAHASVNCHCSMCRRMHAAPYVTWLIVPVTGFRYTKATPATFASSEHGTRYFCARCGTHVACINDTHPEIVDIAVGCCDQPELLAPNRDYYTDTKLPWV